MSSCQDLQSKIQQLKNLKQQFEQIYSTLPPGSNREPAKREVLEEANKKRDEIDILIEQIKQLTLYEARQFAEKLRLKEQYESQVKCLTGTGILEFLSKSQRMGIKDILGQEQPIPAYEDILNKLDNPETRKLLETKSEQGFTKMIFVPFGAKISQLIASYKEVLLKHHQAGTLKATNGDTLELDENEPVWTWDKYQQADENGKLVYYPKQFDKTKHQGLTKKQLVNQGEAWQIILVEDLPDLPAENQGKTLNQRKQLEANQTPKDYLKTIQTNTTYQSEQGLTPESWLAYALTQLEEANQVIDDWDGQGKASFLINSYFPESDGVPDASWNRDYRQANLDRDGPDSRSGDFGCRVGVRI